MIIRYGVESDLSALVDIYNQAVAKGHQTCDTEPVSVNERRGWFVDHSKEQYPILVAEQDSKVIGYLTISPYRYGRQALRFTAEVSYYVDQKSQNIGVGSSLLKEAIGKCPDINLKTLFAIVCDTNVPSITILKKFNFKEWGHLPDVADFNGEEVGHLYYGLRILNDV